MALFFITIVLMTLRLPRKLIIFPQNVLNLGQFFKNWKIRHRMPLQVQGKEGTLSGQKQNKQTKTFRSRPRGKYGTGLELGQLGPVSSFRGGEKHPQNMYESLTSHFNSAQESRTQYTKDRSPGPPQEGTPFPTTARTPVFLTGFWVALHTT